MHVRENQTNKYKKYYSYFRMRFIAGLQYRAAALAGIATQFAWGFLTILMYKAFYEVNPEAFPMKFEALSSYIWLQQAFLAMYMTWIMENEIFQAITDGGIAYEMCRPAELYYMWFFRSMANRLSRAVLRCMPILLVAAFLPEPYGLNLPDSVHAGIWSLISAILGFLVVVAFCMLIYLSAFFTISVSGVRMLAISIVEFCAGLVIPIPFMPDGIKQIMELLPFASMQNVFLRVYSGDISGTQIYWRIFLQLFWLILILWTGKRITTVALKRVVVQGG